MLIRVSARGMSFRGFAEPIVRKHHSGSSLEFRLCPVSPEGNGGSESRMTGDSNGAIAAARQRTQLRQRVRHSDSNGTIAYKDAGIASPASHRYCHVIWGRTGSSALADTVKQAETMKR
jgi:hypothetical protein